MHSRRALSLFGVIATLVALEGSSFAHDLWVERQDAAFVLRYGHRGGEVLVLPGAKVKKFVCRPAKGDGSDLLASAKREPKQMSVAGPCAVVSAFLDGGFWSLTPDGEKNLPRHQVSDAVKAWRSRQFAKWVDVRSPLAGLPLGDEFEIVPVSDLAKLKAGDKATFRVHLAGKPLPGATLAINHHPLGETDDRGEVRVKIRAQDVEAVSASFRRPVKSPEADSEVYEASLTFEVAR